MGLTDARLMIVSVNLLRFNELKRAKNFYSKFNCITTSKPNTSYTQMWIVSYGVLEKTTGKFWNRFIDRLSFDSQFL